MYNRKMLSDKMTDIIASALHYQDYIPPIDQRETAQMVMDRTEGWKRRYHHDPRFNARVQMIVAGLMQGLDHVVERAISEAIMKELSRELGEAIEDGGH